jgi:glycerate kinase
VELLRRRLERLAQVYREESGVEVLDLEGGGAAGGLAGGLAALGAELISGFDLVASETDLLDAFEGADLVVTGEGFLDAQSFEGKVVGGVIELATSVGVPVVVVAGEVFEDASGEIDAISLVDHCGRERAVGDTLACIEEVVLERISGKRRR